MISEDRVVKVLQLSAFLQHRNDFGGHSEVVDQTAQHYNVPYWVALYVATELQWAFIATPETVAITMNLNVNILCQGEENCEAITKK